MTWQDRVSFWRQIVHETRATSFLDVGCGRGDNMLALRSINEDFELSGVDSNRPALQEAQSHGFDVDLGTLDELLFLLPPPGEENRSRPLPRHQVADLVSLTLSSKLLDVDGYARALATLDDASRRWVLLVDLELAMAEEHFSVATLALVKRAGRRLVPVRCGVAEGFGCKAMYALLRRDQ